MKPVIFGCAGPALSDTERAFFEAEQPAGFILFARNIQTPQQVKTLTTDLRLCVDRSNLLIAIDQEGGRVQRMGPPHWRKYPAMALFGKAAQANFDLAARALELNCLLLADDLRRAGINVDCLPLLDVPREGADNVIGDRALATTPELVGQLGQVVTESLMQAGILPVVKHIPGHGRATVDSHKFLPRVGTSFEELASTDFEPFKMLSKSPLGMTAHIVYDAFDKQQPATLSSAVINDVIRGFIGFQGLLMTDDLSMQALSGMMGERAKASLDAGCDMVLHCNGDMNEMKRVAEVLPPAEKALEQAITKMIDSVVQKAPIDRSVVEADHDAVMQELDSIV